MNPPVQS